MERWEWKDYRAEDESDPFQLIAPDKALFILLIMFAAAAIFERYL